ncbi:glycosyltransferase family protein [Zunongwangia sp. HRR-M8]|uniref:glycosyltransferase family protein n=1 Tax=Zunongwangia sp. HRR-M8 TaxID=3015170 RepID=UPI0022DD1C46|nr:glycosyltransferase [Zunongwangia sp. HRR-M8]WBL21660.1 glycosyltransferase [Zunongwangia sp. HRR-M8]
MHCIRVIDPDKKIIIFLSSDNDIIRERKAYLNAFKKDYNIVCCLDYELNSVIESMEKQGEIFLILYPDPCEAIIPENILKLNYPTACFQIDTYDGTSARFNEAMLFDHAFIFHPKYDELLSEKGHPSVTLLPHAVETNLYPDFKADRAFDVGWVGRLDGSFYKIRKEQVEAISKNFKTNDINKFYNQDELISIYTNSKIAINISRDDYMIDANLRCFEILAAGALLITKKPTELNEIGLVAGKHFVTYTTTEELLQKIKYYLENDKERNRIALQGYKQVNLYHDFSNRVEKIREAVHQNNSIKLAPAKKWTDIEINEVFFAYYAHRRKLTKAIKYGMLLLKSRYNKSFYVFKNLGRIVFLNVKFYTK